MKQFWKSHWNLAAGILLAATLLGAGSYDALAKSSQPQGNSPLIGALRKFLPERDVTVASVNGQPVSIQSLELTKAAIQTNQPQIGTTQAYQQAMQAIVRQDALVMEARRRGFTVSKEEAMRYWQQAQAQVKDSPEVQAVLKAQQEAYPGPEEEEEAKIIAAYQDMLAVGEMNRALADGVAPPSDAEVAQTLAEQPIPNRLVLIPVEFPSWTKAQEALDELQGLLTTQGSRVMEETLTGFAEAQLHIAPGQPLHKEFDYHDRGELPDYGQAALELPENSLGVYQRADGTGVVYLVLQSVTVNPTEAFQQVREQLWQQSRDRYLADFTAGIVAQARVDYVAENMPPEAQEALLSRAK